MISLYKHRPAVRSNRHFYVYQPPRPLEEIDADLDKVSAEIMGLLREVHS